MGLIAVASKAKFCWDLAVMAVMFLVYLPWIVTEVVSEVLEYEGPPWVRRAIKNRHERKARQ